MDNGAPAVDHLEWQIMVFCRNEERRIAACLTSVAAAVGTHRALITVIVNGSTDGSLVAAQATRAAINIPLEIFTITHGDKSNAINVALHDRVVRHTAALYFFVDGYVTISPDALVAVAERLAAHPDAVAATGVPGNGRSARRARQAAIDQGGVLYGQLYALTTDFVERIATAKIGLPVGLYRGDGLLGSMAAHDLDALGRPWRDSRLIGVPEAVFAIDALSIFRWRDLRRQFRRKVRQMRGRLENAAIKKLIYVGGYAALPDDADDMIQDFLSRHPVPPTSWRERPFMALALRDHRLARRLRAGTLIPQRAP